MHLMQILSKERHVLYIYGDANGYHLDLGCKTGNPINKNLYILIEQSHIHWRKSIGTSANI